MAVQDVTSPPLEDPPFELRALEVLQELREAFLQLIESLPDRTSRAADLDKALGVSRTLGWQIHRVATSRTPLEAGTHVPGMAAVQQVLRAARAAGAPEERLRDAARAMEAFESLVEQHAGDRATFATMLNSLAGRDAEAIDLKMRRQAFRVNSQIWGVQAKTTLTCDLHRPGRTSDVCDIVSIRGLRDIRRLRSGAPFRLTTQRMVDAHDHAVPSQSIRPGPTDAPAGPNLLHEFCTQPTPQLDNRFEGQRMHTYLRETPLGNAGAQTLYIADVTRGIEWKAPGDERNTHSRFSAIMKPVESLVLDTLIHKDMFSELDWEVRVCGSLDRLGEIDPDRYMPEETLPIKAELLELGVGVSGLSTPHVPRYREMVESVCRDVGWSANDFRVYRCIVEYPLLSSVVSVRFLLPDTGNW